MTACKLAREIAAGRLSAREAVEVHIARIESVNASLNAVVVTRFDEARREADEADASRRRGESKGLLDGVPITIKESFDVTGTPTTLGLTERAATHAASDAPTVRRLREAGAIILGKTNVPQLVMLNETDNPLYGRTNNPWNLARSPGGSSGGCAAIVAAGGASLSLGSDIGGSVRFPAHACGVSSLKPTSGRLTMHGHAPIFDGQEAIQAQPGPLARSVADLRLALNVLTATDDESLDASHAHIKPLRDVADIAHDKLRVAFFTDNGILRPAPAVRRAVESAARALAERGVEVEEWQPPSVAEAWMLYQGLLFADGMAWARHTLGKSRRDWRINLIVRSLALPRSLHALGAWELSLFKQTHLADNLRRLGALSVAAYWKLLVQRADYRARFMQSLDDGRFDAIISPPDALPARTHGLSFLLSDALSYSSLYNLLGMPAGVVGATRVRAGEESDRATGWDVVERFARKVENGSAGMPVGVQVAARHWREDVALALMSLLEEHFQQQPDYPRLQIAD
ncbi:MAG TPA: amidase family protein [Pyrinomonadaceae bacterium]|jgi:fatty acid amide hydrolase